MGSVKRGIKLGTNFHGRKPKLGIQIFVSGKFEPKNIDLVFEINFKVGDKYKSDGPHSARVLQVEYLCSNGIDDNMIIMTMNLA